MIGRMSWQAGERAQHGQPPPGILFAAEVDRLEHGAPDRRALAARFAISETEVKNRLARTRARLKRHLREALVQTVERDDELAQELAWLFEGGP